MFWSVLAFLGSYGLRENANGSAESMAVSSQFDALGEIPIAPPQKKINLYIIIIIYFFFSETSFLSHLTSFS